MGGRGAKQLKENSSPKSNFNDYRFEGLGASRISNKYLTMNRISEDGNRIIVKVSNEHLISTSYGYGLILDNTHVVWLKKWQVSQNYYGNEVLLTKQYFKPKQWGNFENFRSIPKNLRFSEWKRTAKLQQTAKTEVKWQDEKPKFYKSNYIKI